ncbi:MAG: DUF4854 domain-containing protein [Prevotellaceae bacterium]|nr:DUF4854 domain-containing protein [Prevotellaceae bacterium]
MDTTQERVLKALGELGFQTRQLEDFGYSFSYEGKTLIYLLSDDESFLSVALPGILDYNEADHSAFHALAEKLNSTLKYVKACRLGDSLWLFLERELLGEEDVKLAVSHAIVHLEAAFQLACQLIGEEAGV